MSTTQATSVESAAGNRRSHPRRRVERLAYIRFDNGSGGILLDIGEGGFKFQGIASSMEGELCVVKFTLPGSPRTIEVRGQISWSNSSKKGGGVRFLELPEDVRLQIREWMASEMPRLIPTKPAGKPFRTILSDAKPITATSPATQQPMARHSVFQSGVRPGAGKFALAMNQPIAPPLSDTPVVPQAQIYQAPPVPPAQPVPALPPDIITIAAAEPPQKPSESVVDKLSVPPVQPPTPERKPVKEPARIAQPARAVPDRARVVAEPAPVVAEPVVMLATLAIFPRSESVLFAKASTGKVSVAKDDRPKISSRVAQIVGVIAAVCVMAFATFVGISRRPALLSSFRRTSLQKNSQVAASSSPSPIAAAVQDPQVEPAESANQPPIVQDGGDSAAPSAPAENDLVSSQPSEASPLAPAPPESRPFEPSAPVQRAVPHLILQAPKSRQAASSQIALDAPRVADGMTSGNLVDPQVLVANAAEVPAPAQPVIAGSTGFREAVLIHSVRALYPRNFKPGTLGSVVHVSAAIDKDGVPGSLKVVSGDPRLSAAALAALSQWRYDPALLNNQPVESAIIITVNF